MNILDMVGQTTMDKVQAERPVPRFEPGDTLKVRILETDADGPILAATFSGVRSEMRTPVLLKAFFAMPLLTFSGADPLLRLGSAEGDAGAVRGAATEELMELHDWSRQLLTFQPYNHSIAS